jgi:hypothetical protein
MYSVIKAQAKVHEDWDAVNDGDAYQLLVKLSFVSKVVPPHLEIVGIQIKSKEYPIATGGFADVYKGRYKDNSVAVKRPRLLGDTKAGLEAQQVVALRTSPFTCQLSLSSATLPRSVHLARAQT